MNPWAWLRNGLPWLAAFWPASGFSTAPESLAGKIFRDYGRVNVGVIATFQYWESTIIFETDGRYRYLVSGAGSDLVPDPATRSRVAVQAPLPDGIYIYTKIDATHATLELRDVTGSLPRGGTVATLNLTFEADSSGYVNGLRGGTNAILPRHLFSISDPANARNAPANISLRGRVSAGSPVLAGFVVPGTVEREVLIRAIGPSLGGFGVGDVWADPDFQLYRGNAPAAVQEVHRGDWSAGNVAGVRRIFDFVGAFDLAAGSRDAADIVRLSPGDYTVLCRAPAGDAGGEVLIEVYFLP